MIPVVIAKCFILGYIEVAEWLNGMARSPSLSKAPEQINTSGWFQ